MKIFFLLYWTKYAEWERASPYTVIRATLSRPSPSVTFRHFRMTTRHNVNNGAEKRQKIQTDKERFQAVPSFPQQVWSFFTAVRQEGPLPCDYNNCHFLTVTPTQQKRRH